MSRARKSKHRRKTRRNGHGWGFSSTFRSNRRARAFRTAARYSTITAAIPAGGQYTPRSLDNGGDGSLCENWRSSPAEVPFAALSRQAPTEWSLPAATAGVSHTIVSPHDLRSYQADSERPIHLRARKNAWTFAGKRFQSS